MYPLPHPTLVSLTSCGGFRLVHYNAHCSVEDRDASMSVLGDGREKTKLCEDCSLTGWPTPS